MGSPAPRMDPSHLFDKTDLNEYSVGEKLGQGAYTTVRSAVHIISHKKVAVKTYQRSRISSASRKKLIVQEIQALERLQHPGVIKLYEKVQTSEEFHLVLEYVSGSSLHGYLKRRINRKLSENEAKNILKQLLEVVNYCHDMNVTHRDIKLENIIVLSLIHI